MDQQQGASGGRKKFTVAIEGCCHGELDNIYATLAHLERAEGRKVDLLICCGDFQAVRNLDDLETMSVPVKYRQLMTFWKYYSGQAVAPVPTLFIGGNHEASAYLWELHYGGWAAPNIYFLGYSGAVRFGGHRIAGLSGTYVAQHYGWGHHERLPYDDRAVKSVYHVRELHVHRLMQLKQPTSIFLSHDWPNLITRYGNSRWLFGKKPYFQKEAERGDLGSPPNQQLLEALQPRYWFAAHLHVKFPAVVRHTSSGGGGSQQEQEQQQEQQGEAGGDPGGLWRGVQASDGGGGGGGGGGGAGRARTTRFLALDKCLPGRDFLQVIELDARGPLELCYDAEWLAVLRSTHGLTSTSKAARPLPPGWGGRAGASLEDLEFAERLLRERGAAIPQNFAPTAAAYDPRQGRSRGSMPRADLRNPQTEALLEMLGIPYNLDHAANSSAAGTAWTARPAAAVSGSSTAYRAPLVLLNQQQGAGGAGSDSDTERPPAAAATAAAAPAADEFEIPLDDDDDDAGGGEGQEGWEGRGAGQAAPGGGGALADGAPDSDGEGEGARPADPDDPMFGRVDTGAFPYYTG